MRALNAKVSQLALYRYQLPLRRLLSLPGGSIKVREGLLLQATLDDGQEAWAEASPLPGYSTESVTSLVADAPALLTRFIKTRQQPSMPASLGFACSALVSLPRHDTSLTIPHCMLLTGDEADFWPQLQQLPHGATLKLKVGRQSLAADSWLVQQIQRQRPDLSLRLDANRHWTSHQVRIFFDAIIIPDTVQFFEEPCATLQENLQLAAQHIPIALDESLRDPECRPALTQNITAIVLKPTLMGGIASWSPYLQQAKQQRQHIIFSSSFETPLGLYQLSQWAAHYAPTTAAGLDTEKWLAASPIVATPQGWQIEHSRPDIEVTCFWQYSR